MNIEEIGDRLAIEQIWVKYALALDMCDASKALEVFDDDAVFDVAGKVFTGKSEIAAFFDEVGTMMLEGQTLDPNGRRFGTVRHIVTNLALEIDGERAEGDSYWTEVISTGRFPNGRGKAPALLNMGRYEDVFIKKNGSWFIKERHVVADLFAPAPPHDGYATPLKDAESFPDNDGPTAWSC